jgi:hypothetical protein
MAARSVHVQLNVEGMPNTELILVSSAVTRGEWSSGLRPPGKLSPPETSISWKSEDDGFLAGTRGWVRYYPVTPGGSAPSNPPDEETIYITWDDPYIGENSYASSAPFPYSISGGSILDYKADNDTAVFTLSIVGAPAIAYFVSLSFAPGIVIAYVATNGSNDLFAINNLSPPWNPVNGQQSRSAPALTMYNGQLVLAYAANNSSSDLLISTSDDAVNWSPSSQIGAQSSGTAPAITVFNGELLVAYIANNTSNDLMLATTSDNGAVWNGSQTIQGPRNSSQAQASPFTPAITVIGGELYIAFVANDGSHDLWVTKSSDLTNWTTTPVTGQTSLGTPALTSVTDIPGSTFLGNTLVMVYAADNGTLELISTVSTDGGATWSTGVAIAGPQTSPMPPALATYIRPGQAGRGGLYTAYLVYVSNDSSQRLIVLTSSDGINWESDSSFAPP